MDQSLLNRIAIVTRGESGIGAACVAASAGADVGVICHSDADAGDASAAVGTVFLASTAASYITGATIVIDGGLSRLVGQGA